MKTKLLTLTLSLFLLSTAFAQWGQRNTIWQTFGSANGTNKTGDHDSSVTFIASGATVATIGGVAITMIAGEVIPIRAEGLDELRSISFSVTSGTLVVVEVSRG